MEVSDPAMPSLARALDGELSQPALQRALQAWRRDIADVELRSVRLVRHKPGRRALIEYQVSFTSLDGAATADGNFSSRSSRGDGAQTRLEDSAHAGGGQSLLTPAATTNNTHPESLTLLGKIRTKGLDTKTPALMTALRRAGLDTGGLAVPEAIGVVPEFQMWLQKKIPGVPLTNWPAGADGLALARRVAEAAHKLHGSGVAARRRHTVDDEMNILCDRFDQLAAARPDWRRRLERMAASCAALAESVRHRPTRGIHRDFHPAQILVDEDRLWLLDFDLYCEGDPALDIGNFLGHLTELALRERGDAGALGEIERALESRYLELAGAEARAAVQTWQTLTLARHVSISTQFPERRPFTEALLDLVEKRLELA